MPETTCGTLYGLGVGPGDPKLITLRALEVLKTVDLVFAAGSNKNDYSLALNIVRDHLPPQTPVRKLDFPMTKDPAARRKAWRRNAEEVLAELRQGRHAAFLTLGDPLTYSTFGYLAQTILQMAPQTPVETVPGITAYHAAAARLNLPLVEDRQSLTVVSGVSDAAEISRLARAGGTVVILKTYRNYDAILDALGPLNHGRQAYTVCACGLEGELVARDPESLRGRDMPYLSLMIVKQPAEGE
ncbi:precorrin-2 C20-methyltransferase [Desulfocarbo indianensis]|nr:precorrin-2 C20-methyltransferase [Desulfocarbo indianensis]